MSTKKEILERIQKALDLEFEELYQEESEEKIMLVKKPIESDWDLRAEEDDEDYCEECDSTDCDCDYEEQYDEDDDDEEVQVIWG